MSLSGTLLGKTLAVLLLIAVSAMSYLFVICPLTERIVTAFETIETRRILLGRLEQAIQSAGQAVPSADSSTREAELYLKGESEAVMAASLQTALRVAGEGQGGRVVSIRSLAAKQQTGLRLVGIEGRLNTSLAGLQKTLLALESARPIILVSALQISPDGNSETQTDGRSDQLSVRLEIYGVAASKGQEAVNVPLRQ